MGLITFRCTSCKVGLKVGADKAGRKIKCSKCGTVLTIPAAEPDDDPPPPAPQVTPASADDDDDKSAYSLIQSPSNEAPAETEAKPKKDDKKKPPPIKRKFKSLPDPDLWEKVKAGLQIMMIGGYLWAGSVLLMTIFIVLCITGEAEEYGGVLVNAMGQENAPDLPVFMLDLVVGTGNHGTAKTLYILASVLIVFQFVLLLAGAGICLKVPDRFGMHGQLKALLGVSAVNLFVYLIFKLLPILGISGYLPVPFAMPEVSLVDANINRSLPLWVFWSPSPFWEMFLTMIFLFLFYAAPVLIGVFLWSIGMSLKEDPISRLGQGIVNLSLGIGFTLLAFQLLSMAGTSGVAIGLLRVVYGGWLGFTILLLFRLPMALQTTRAMLQKYLDGAELKDDDDEEEDEEEEDKPKPKRKAKRPRDEDDDSDD
jgi:hypothetical protein